MIFLIEYDPPQGKLILFEQFQKEEWTRAQDKRLEIELDLNRRGINHEVVILEANCEADLHKTHQRYFRNTTEILNQMIEAVKAA
ncbi:MAG: hypothetical protein AAB300_02355 [Nitrospirota bacterium]